MLSSIQVVVIWRWFTLSILALSLSACGGGGGSSRTPDGVVTISDGTGGTVAISDPASPIYGTQVRLLPDSLDSTSETIRITYQDDLPAPLPETALDLGAMQASKTLILSRTGSNDFYLPAEVTLPYDTELVGEDDLPLVFYWNPTSGKYSAVALSNLDRANGTVTFRTAHFSSFVILVLGNWRGQTIPGQVIPEVDTGFRSEVDGFFVTNFGAYDQPSGSCLGMANYAGWYFENKKALKGIGLHSLYKEGDPVLEADDQNVRELISRAYMASSQVWANYALNFQINLGESLTGYYLIQTMLMTGQPQVLLMANESLSNAHAVTVYGYDANNARFLIYDNNRPRETHYLPWSLEEGFGSFSASNVYEKFAFDALHTTFSPATMESFFLGVETGWPASKFATITMQAPTPSASDPNVLIAETETQVEIAGSIPRLAGEDNPNAQRYAHIWVNGTLQYELFPSFPVSTTGDFSTVLANLPNPQGSDLIIVVSESADKWRRGIRGFLQATIRVRNDNEHTLALSFTGNGSGRVLSNPTGIDCVSDCNAIFPDGTTVTLRAIPDEGQAFGGWEGVCTGMASICTVTLDASRAVTAHFITAGPRGWSTPSTISSLATGFGNEPKVALRENGDALLIWVLNDEATTLRSLWHSRYSADIGWSNPGLIESNDGATYDHRLAMNPTSGKGIVAWKQWEPDSNWGAEYHIWARPFSPDTGWGSAARIDNLDMPVGRPDVGVDEGGNAVVVWSSQNPICCSVFANRFSASSGWSTADVIETEFTMGLLHLDPLLHVSPGGEAVSIWSYTNANRGLRAIWSNRMTGNGTWGSALEILNKEELETSGIIALMSAPSLGGDAAGNAVMGMMQATVDINNGGETQFQPIAKRSQVNWQPGVIDIAPSKSSFSETSHLYVASGRNGQTLAAWIEPEGRLVAAVGSSTGGAWATEDTVNITSLGYRSWPLSIAVDDQGNGAIVWEQVSADGGTDIVVANYTAGRGWDTPRNVGSGNAPSLSMNASGDAILAWSSGQGITVSHFESGR